MANATFLKYSHTPESIVRENGIQISDGYRLRRLIAVVIGGQMLIAGVALLFVGEPLITWSGVALALLALMGSVLAWFYRSDICIDLPSRSIIHRWGWGEPSRPMGSPRSLDDYTLVEYASELVSTQHGTAVRYHVGLRGLSGFLKLVSPESKSDCRQYAEVIAKRLELPLVNAEAPDQVREHDALDVSLAETIEITSQFPAAPRGALSRVHHDGETLTIAIPGPTKHDAFAVRLRKWSRIGCLLCTASGIFAVGPTAAEMLLGVAFAGVFACVIYWFAILGTISQRAKQKATIQLDRHGLGVQHIDAFGRSEDVHIPIAELEECYHDLRRVKPDSPEWMDGLLTTETVLTVGSDKTMVSFGCWLSRAEKEYLCDVVKQVLARLAKPIDESSQEQVLT